MVFAGRRVLAFLASALFFVPADALTLMKYGAWFEGCVESCSAGGNAQQCRALCGCMVDEINQRGLVHEHFPIPRATAGSAERTLEIQKFCVAKVVTGQTPAREPQAKPDARVDLRQSPSKPTASASTKPGPNHLAPPAVYDNAASGFGQVFTAERHTFSGIRFYIGDPTRPGNPEVNALEGEADLVLYTASDLAKPVEVARTRVQESGHRSTGLTTFQLKNPVPVVIGQQYFVAIETADARFGLGLRDALRSTYNGGYQASLSPAAGITPNPNGRDTSFEVLGEGR